MNTVGSSAASVSISAVTDEAALERLKANGQVVLTYVNEKGEPGEPAGYPANPNGAAGDVAGICDPTGRVVGLMPHPERMAEPTHGNTEGATLFQSLVGQLADA